MITTQLIFMMESGELRLNYVRERFSKYLSVNYIKTRKKDATGFYMAYYEKRHVHISDYALLIILPPKLRKMTQHHQIMCGCKICIQVGTYQEPLNHWRKQQLRYTNNHEN